MKSSRLIQKNSEIFYQINQSPTNRSVSKNTYAFGKSSRFPELKPQCPVTSYLPDKIEKSPRGASISSSKKSDFTKDLTCSPGSSKYAINTAFEQNINKNKGFSIGASRENLKFRSYINRQLCRNPSASNYHTLDVSSSPRFSIRARTKVLNKSMTIEPQNNNPGPGNYIDPEKQYRSKFANRFPTISYAVSRSERFSSSDNRVPGPASYKSGQTLSYQGKYIDSRHQGAAVAKFGNSKRKTQFDQAIEKSRRIPGAGSYRVPSQFGNYDGDIYEKLQRIEVPSYRTNQH